MSWSCTVLEIGDGIRLRAWRPDDIDALLRHANDAQVARGVSDRFPHPYKREDAEAFLAGDVVDFSHPCFAIELDGEACGGVGIRPIVGERRIGAEFGYWLGRAHWGRGVMSKVVAAFAPWAMSQLSLQRLQATVLGFNLASARVLQKSGFLEEGVMRRAACKGGIVHDLRLFSRLAGDPP